MDRVAGPVSRVLSSSQLAMLADHGEERTAAVGETLFEVGDESYPFVAIIEGEVMVTDAAGQEIVRHGASGFVGEMNLLSGQTVFLTAVVTKKMRYIAVDREVLRQLLFEDGALSDLLLSAFVERRELLQQQQGIGFEIVGLRESPDTRRLLDFARRQRLPHTWVDPATSGAPAGAADAAPAPADAAPAPADAAPGPAEMPVVRLPGGAELHNPSNGE
ncbi:MAG: cyclic nucleotide-binding domain-containing protein, partial [Solirubrobacteraceae bacterium]